MSSRKPREIFITFEGGDGAGKTTLIEGIYKALLAQGKRVVKTRAPGATAAGQVIRSLLLNHGEIPLSARCELFLFLADRAQHVETVIMPALERGEIVLCDRYNDSTIAYQGVGRGLGVDKVAEFCRFATHSLEPTLTLYLDLDPHIGLARVDATTPSKDRIEAETFSFHEKIRAAFLQLAREHPKRLRVLDASKPKESVLQAALREIHALHP